MTRPAAGSGDPFVSGFSIARNAVKYGYPIEAALRSIAPLCDEIVVNVGVSDDGTLERIRGIGDPKIRIVETDWGDETEIGSRVLSIQTNRALAECRGTWCYYVQADEVLHEQGLTSVRETLRRYANDPRVEGLLFDYLHFYGSFDWVGLGRRFYRREVRIVRKASGIRSVGDAQGFRVGDRKPRTVHSGGRIFHYGWAKRPELAEEKRLMGYRLHRLDLHSMPRYAFRRLPGLRPFRGTHPAVMREWIAEHHWEFDPRDYPRDWSWKSIKAVFSNAVERWTGWRPFEHRNFQRVD